MTADGGVVAEVFVLDRWLAGSHCVEEICLVSGNVTVTIRCGKSLGLDDLVIERCGLRMFRRPLREIFLAQAFRPTFSRIGFWLGRYVLRNEGQGLPDDLHGAFGPVEFDRLTAGVIEIAAQHHAEFREV